MKNPIYFLAIICLLLSSCGDSSKTQTVRVSGHFKNIASKNALLESTSDSIIKLKSLVIGEKFEFEFELDKPLWFRLHLKEDKCEFPINSELYLEPGDDIELSGNASDFYDSVIATGRGAEENNYLFSKFRIYYPDCAGWPPNKSLEVNEFSSQLDNMKTAVAKKLALYNDENSMNKHFVDFETRKANYRWAYTKCTYPSFYKDIHDVAPNIPHDFYDFLEEINYSDEEMYYSKNRGSKYVYLVWWHLMGKVDDQKTGIDSFKDQYEVIDNTIKNEKMKDEFIHDLISDQSKVLTVDELKVVQNTFLTNEDYKRIIQKQLEKVQ